MEEIWAAYDEWYDVSNFGRVRSWKKGGRGGRKNTPLIKKLTLHNTGRLVTKINGKSMYVHRLVLLTFVGEPKEGEECLHRDGNPKNNHLENLMWGSPKENGNDKIKHGRSTRGVKHPLNKLSEDDVREIRRRISNGERNCDIALDFGVSRPRISSIKTGENWGWLK